MLMLFLAGSLFVVVFLVRKSFLTKLVSPTNKIVRELSGSSWFHHPIWSGVFLFLTNTLLFGITATVLFLLSYFFIPYLHLAIILLAIFASLFIWTAIYHADHKTKKDRVLMSFLGSSFYLLLLGYAVLNMIFPTTIPDAPEHDQFMEFIGMLILSIIALTASFTCFVITGLYRKKNNGNSPDSL